MSSVPRTAGAQPQPGAAQETFLDRLGIPHALRWGFLGSAVVALVRPWGGDVGVVWAFVLLYGCAFVMTFFLKVDQPRAHGKTIEADDHHEHHGATA